MIDRVRLVRAVTRSVVIVGWTAIVGFVHLALISLGTWPDEFGYLVFVAYLALFLTGTQWLQLGLEERHAPRLRGALAATAVLWVALSAAFVLAQTCTIQTLTMISTRSFSGSLAHVARFLVDVMQLDGRATDDNGIVRTSALLLPVLVPWTWARVAKGAIGGLLRYLVFFAAVPVVLAIQCAVADRFHPFTYKCPGWNGYLDVVNQCSVFVAAGVFVLPLVFLACDAVAKDIGNAIVRDAEKSTVQEGGADCPNRHG